MDYIEKTPSQIERIIRDFADKTPSQVKHAIEEWHDDDEAGIEAAGELLSNIEIWIENFVDEINERRRSVRTAVADLLSSFHCDHGNKPLREDAERRLAGLLMVPMLSDTSGYDFYQFTTRRLEGEGE